MVLDVCRNNYPATLVKSSFLESRKHRDKNIVNKNSVVT